uniref:Uncharacterized protein n=1 Tax=Rhizophora mucronata TaxID=61149 RepID=A0A2P2MYF5_RHIMU
MCSDNCSYLFYVKLSNSVIDALRIMCLIETLLLLC